MKRKRLLMLAGCTVSLLFAGYLTLHLTAPRHRITKENLATLRVGMTEKDVEAILGVPAGVYSASTSTGFYSPKTSLNMINGGGFVLPFDADIFFKTGSDLIKLQGGKEWVGETLSIYVRFDDACRVMEFRYGEVQTSNESFLIKLRSWLGVQ